MVTLEGVRPILEESFQNYEKSHAAYEAIEYSSASMEHDAALLSLFMLRAGLEEKYQWVYKEIGEISFKLQMVPESIAEKYVSFTLDEAKIFEREFYDYYRSRLAVLDSAYGIEYFANTLLLEGKGLSTSCFKMIDLELDKSVSFFYPIVEADNDGKFRSCLKAEGDLPLFPEEINQNFDLIRSNVSLRFTKLKDVLYRDYIPVSWKLDTDEFSFFDDPDREREVYLDRIFLHSNNS